MPYSNATRDQQHYSNQHAANLQIQSGTSNTEVEDGEKRDDGKREKLAAQLGPSATTIHRGRASHTYTQESKKIWDQ
jgi:hypothetical protein